MYWAASPPTRLTDVIESAPTPLFVTVIRRESLTVLTRWPPKSCAVADAASTGWVPVPLKATWVAPDPESLGTSSEASGWAPRLVGLNVMSTVHRVPIGSSVELHVSFAIAYWPASAPESVSCEMPSGSVHRS